MQFQNDQEMESTELNLTQALEEAFEEAWTPTPKGDMAYPTNSQVSVAAAAMPEALVKPLGQPQANQDDQEMGSMEFNLPQVLEDVLEQA